MIYLDNAATTAMAEGCLAVFEKYACQTFFNPSAGYRQALSVGKELDEARSKVLSRLGADCGDIIFTGGATESNNLAVMGSKRNGKWEYIFSLGEHPSVYNVARELEAQGHIVYFVGLQPNGQIDYDKLEKLLNERTRLISVIHVSNETGAVNDVVKIDRLRKKFAPNALFHVDGVQAFCKLPVNLKDFNPDFYTISAHKFHGPKGVGALYIKDASKLKNIIYGGGQEKGYRSGTENVAGVMAMVYAMENIDVASNLEKVTLLQKVMTNTLRLDENVKILETDSPYILSCEFSGVNGETLMRALQDEDVLVGIGSACSTKKAGNRILESMGHNKDSIKSHIRISFDATQSEQEIRKAGEIILKTYRRIWEKVK